LVSSKDHDDRRYAKVFTQSINHHILSARAQVTAMATAFLKEMKAILLLTMVAQETKAQT
jgi:hypothetical protein